MIKHGIDKQILNEVSNIGHKIYWMGHIAWIHIGKSPNLWYQCNNFPQIALKLNDGL